MPDMRRFLTTSCAVILALVFLTNCTRVVRVEQGYASWYGRKENGKETASGEKYRQSAMTAAHKTLPFDTEVRVTNLSNDRSVKVRINDRGPYVDGRIIDLSKGAARKIDMINSGVAPVKVEVLK